MSITQLQLLGGRDKLGIEGIEELSPAIRRGFPWSAVNDLADALKLTRSELATILGVSDSTLTRRRRQETLSPAASDRWARFARLVSQAMSTLGGEENAVRWLRTAQRTLGGERPLELLNDDAGAERVREALLRAEYGMYG